VMTDVDFDRSDVPRCPLATRLSDYDYPKIKSKSKMNTNITDQRSLSVRDLEISFRYLRICVSERGADARRAVSPHVLPRRCAHGVRRDCAASTRPPGPRASLPGAAPSLTLSVSRLTRAIPAPVARPPYECYWRCYIQPTMTPPEICGHTNCACPSPDSRGRCTECIENLSSRHILATAATARTSH
jgi:hypothetical protein